MAAVDNCPERMHAADAEAPRPPRIETAVEFWSGMGVETAARTKLDICPERVEYSDFVLQTDSAEKMLLVYKE